MTHEIQINICLTDFTYVILFVSVNVFMVFQYMLLIGDGKSSQKAKITPYITNNGGIWPPYGGISALAESQKTCRRNRHGGYLIILNRSIHVMTFSSFLKISLISSR